MMMGGIFLNRRLDRIRDWFLEITVRELIDDE